MSKRFKTQDYFRYKKLGKRWRRPVGLQSKLRLRKGGSGMRVSVGYGTAEKARPLLVRNVKDLEKDCSNGVTFASSLGAKKTVLLSAKAKELGITIVNMKKVRRAAKIAARIGKKKSKKPGEEKTDGAKKSGSTPPAQEKKMGFHGDIVPQLLDGKTKTYRLRDHDFKVGDKVAFENSQMAKIFGRGKITNVERTTVGKIDLKDKGHYKTYDKVEELIEAFKKHHPEKDVTPETDAWVYTYEFTPTTTKEKK